MHVGDEELLLNILSESCVTGNWHRVMLALNHCQTIHLLATDKSQ
jgi:hypothetical protein